jgi:hypothetical protein
VSGEEEEEEEEDSDLKDLVDDAEEVGGVSSMFDVSMPCLEGVTLV